jgi:primosomal protein N' (replication factor Y)
MTPAIAALDAWIRAFASSRSRPPLLTEAQAAVPAARDKVKRLVALGRLRLEHTARATSSAGVASSPRPSGRTLTEAQARAAAVLTTAVHEAAAVANEPAASSDRPATGTGRAFLLEGVTGSGKTEVYLQALRACLDAGRGAILIVPEIALTPQLVARAREGLGDRAGDVVLLHSNVPAGERRDGQARLLRGEARVAIGARSALFTAVPSLGLIVVDEEHDGSLKNGESPRYHARDVALWRARNEGAVCVLGSATPSLESRHNVATGKIERLELPSRVGGGGALPSIELVDLRARGEIAEARRRDRDNADDGPGVVLSGPLVDAMAETLAGGDQVLLFLNKRGYAAALLCEACGRIERCPHCSVSLTVHKHDATLRCHQCGHEQRLPPTCPACASEALLQVGLGTERLEAEVKARFPDARVARLDRDSTQRKGALEQVLRAVHAREIDVLLGTQMLAKGHDFPHVQLVGVVLADIALSMPDFRASERAFALLAQVAGRAGRGAKRGRVLVQTYDPEHEALRGLVDHDVQGFAARALEERKLYGYPPFTRLARVVVEHADDREAARIARAAAKCMTTRAALLSRGAASVLGPAPCPLERVAGRSRQHVLLRARSHADRAVIVAALQADAALHKATRTASARLILDLDPVHML